MAESGILVAIQVSRECMFTRGRRGRCEWNSGCRGELRIFGLFIHVEEAHGNLGGRGVAGKETEEMDVFRKRLRQSCMMCVGMHVCVRAKQRERVCVCARESEDALKMSDPATVAVPLLNRLDRLGKHHMERKVDHLAEFRSV